MKQNWQREAVRIHEGVVKLKGRPPWTDDDRRFLALALCGEVGELANVIKKDWRGDAGDRIQALTEEFADIRIYLELLAASYSVDLDAACEAKTLELYERWPHLKPAA